MPAGNPETGYLDVDASPTKTTLLTMGRNGEKHLFNYSFAKRPAEELYDLRNDLDCMQNLAQDQNQQGRMADLKKRLHKRLIEQQDPRLLGEGDVFDNYRYDTENKWNFYERVVSGELKEPWKQTGWVNPTDYEQYKAPQKSKSNK